MQAGKKSGLDQDRWDFKALTTRINRCGGIAREAWLEFFLGYVYGAIDDLKVRSLVASLKHNDELAESWMVFWLTVDDKRVNTA